MSEDTRIAYGARCVWWDSIENVGHVKLREGATLPCCPHCRNMLFEMADEQEWFTNVDKYEASGHPGYRRFVEWLRGKCFPTTKAAQAAYNGELWS